MQNENIEALVQSKSLWKCLSCFACVERCPRDVKPGKLIDAARQLVIRQRGQNYPVSYTHLDVYKRQGWEEFTDAAIRVLNEQDRPMVFMLWGRPAQMKRSMLNNPKHLILEAPHPSPLSAYRGFFGCKHFSKANEFLKEHGMEPIDWQIENQ